MSSDIITSTVGEFSRRTGISRSQLYVVATSPV